MISTFEKYDEYKESGIDGCVEVPAHWEVERLKNIASIQYSNVDKKTEKDEVPVKLCNYVDVYKNEFIDYSFEFMQATAKEREIKRFAIRKHDVLITKDSETADDIASPALVNDSFTNVLCGYHLAQIRTSENTLYAPFLFRLFQSSQYNFRFTIYAKGITRVGLSTSSFSDALTPVPPLPEQKAIAAYLDEKTVQIDQKIALLQQKAERYAELKQALINETVTRGLDKDAPLKDSGIEWIGKIPAHWEVKRAKSMFTKMSRSVQDADEIVTVFRDGEVTLRKNRRTTGFTYSAKEHGYQGIRVGDLVIHAMDAAAGAVGVSDSEGKSTPVYSVYTPINQNEIYNPYYALLIRQMALSGFVASLGKGIRERSTEFRHKTFAPLHLPVPPYEEQKAIADYLDEKSNQIEKIIATIEAQIEKLAELRKTLINDVVTGQIKVV